MATLVNTDVDENERKKFERWATNEGYYVHKEGNRYCQVVVNSLLKAWMASKKV